MLKNVFLFQNVQPKRCVKKTIFGEIAHFDDCETVWDD